MRTATCWTSRRDVIRNRGISCGHQRHRSGLLMGRRRRQIDGASVQLGARAYRHVERQYPELPFDSQHRPSYRGPTLEELEAHLATGGAALRMLTTRSRLSLPTSEFEVIVNRRIHGLRRDACPVFLLPAGQSALRLAPMRIPLGRTLATVDLAPSRCFEIEYRFRTPDGFFKPDSLREPSPDEWPVICTR